MIELLVVRHGESQLDWEEDRRDHIDCDLTPLGERQAGLAAAWIANRYRPHEIISSPLKRAARTAEAIAQECKLSVSYDEDLIEKSDDLNHNTHSFIYDRAQAEAFLLKILTAHRSKSDLHRICIVSHGAVIELLFHSLINLPFQTEISLATGDTGIHLWRIDGSRRRIIFMNAQDHLRI
ncbi:histidine phosphatase family protein [Saccharibacillus sp. JS10]|uniref:histidine phosphatase family protein n=1 Tax=Saccharibacillus sp. JS10 TaxID=2950552 RepID=UPI00210BF1B0|nr:histidine phosphatase family protein [Saccharibacillus sp. JS10]MCQ4087063.1 histidine phosphatase family protein [Saccharibacillus sp. JS10]